MKFKHKGKIYTDIYGSDDEELYDHCAMPFEDEIIECISQAMFHVHYFKSKHFLLDEKQVLGDFCTTLKRKLGAKFCHQNNKYISFIINFLCDVDSWFSIGHLSHKYGYNAYNLEAEKTYGFTFQRLKKVVKMAELLSVNYKNEIDKEVLDINKSIKQLRSFGLQQMQVIIDCADATNNKSDIIIDSMYDLTKTITNVED